MPAAVPYLMIAAATVSAGASVLQGAQQRKVMDQEADTEQQVAGSQAQQQELQSRARLGAALATAGASGVDPSQGTPLAVMSELATQGELNSQLTLWQGQVRSQQLRYQGSQAFTAGLIGAGKSLLTGATGYAKEGGSFPDLFGGGPTYGAVAPDYSAASSGMAIGRY